MKLSFYEQIEEANFFTKMFSGGDEKTYKESLVKSYQIL